MTKFNTSTTKRDAKLTTKEGSEAYDYTDPRNELVALVATSFLNDKFYESSHDAILRMHTLMDSCISAGHYEFLWKLFYVARTQWNMRSVTHVLAGYLLSRKDENKNYPMYVGDILSKGWVRPDDMMETFAYYALMNKSESNQPLLTPYHLRRGAEKRFARMSEFHAGKYPGDGLRFSLKNILRMVRPTPVNEKQSTLFKGIKEGTIKAIDTNWRAKVDYLISTEGKTNKQAFTAVLDDMGLFAIVNNLNTFDRHGVNEGKVLKRLENREAVVRSRMLPFRFAKAIKMVSNKAYKDALMKCLDWSFDNLVLPKGNYLIAVDTSGSMGYSYEDTKRAGSGLKLFYDKKGKDVDSPIETASLFGAILAHKANIDPKNKVHLIAFATEMEAIETFDKGIYAIKEELTNYDRRMKIGYGTNGYLVYDYANQPMTPDFDYIFMITDMQWSRFHFTEHHKKALTVFVNMQGYDSTLVPFMPQDRRVELSGLSDKIFDYIEVINDPMGIVNKITMTDLSA